MMDDRRSGAVTPSSTDYRLPSRRDRDRILYSAEFRRLTGVTQVTTATEQLLVHNRSTHSSRVEQVAAALIVHSNGIRADASRAEHPAFIDQASQWRAAAAGLAHDLGHPPFGHVGEQALNSYLVCQTHLDAVPVSRWSPNGTATNVARDAHFACADCRLPDGFEGNAQTFRILTKLTVRGYGVSSTATGTGGARLGLDLTRGTLAACTKYPWLRGDNSTKPAKWGAYDSEAADLAFAIGATNQTPLQSYLAGANGSSIKPSLAASVMDWADDITYAVHDIDDFFRLGIIPLDQLVSDASRQRQDFVRYARPAADHLVRGHLTASFLEQDLLGTMSSFPPAPFGGTVDDLAQLNDLTSKLITYFISATTLDAASTTQDWCEVSPRARYTNEMLKRLTGYYVIDNPALATMQIGQQKVVRNLVEALDEAATDFYINDAFNESKRRRLPETLRNYIDWCMADPGAGVYTERQRVTRGVVDFVSSLTDLGAFRLNARLNGDADVSILDPSVAF